MADKDKPRDYHHYVFRDGKLVGEFEKMYRESSGIPWAQDEQWAQLNWKLALQMLAHHGPYERVVELGAGLGFFCEALRPMCSGTVLGLDVAPTAVECASQKFPQCQFQVLDLTKPLAPSCPIDHASLLVARTLMWYVFEQLDVFIENLHRLTAPGGLLFVQQNFPPADSQFVGKDTLPNPEALVEHLQGRFRPVEIIYKLDCAGRPNDNWVYFLGRPR